MSEIAERVARALYAENNPYGKHPTAWQSYMGDARAAIAAMSEPTDAMLAAYIGALESSDVGNKGLWHRHKGRKRWMAMIEEALK